MGDLFSCVPAVDAHLESFLARRAMPSHLREACRYALLGGGKRLRPVLVCESCVAAGGRIEQSLGAAAALEMIHAFSLVHDDLPALDNDDMRRGRPTLHRHAGEAMAILAGDALMGLAFELLAESGNLGLIVELAAATNDMIAGQVQDTLPAFLGEMTAASRLHWIHRHKTGALIRCACRMGALAAKADTKTLAQLTVYGTTLGILFQAVDDLLDVTGDAQIVGKATAKDAVSGKLTYPSVYGVTGTRDEIKRLRGEAIAALSSLGTGGDRLTSLACLMADRDH